MSAKLPPALCPPPGWDEAQDGEWTEVHQRAADRVLREVFGYDIPASETPQGALH